MIVFGSMSVGIAAPDDWIDQVESKGLSAWSYYAEPGNGEEVEPQVPSASLACLPYVNVSLGQEGYAVITALMLVPAPDYPPFQYTIDIMGPLTNTVYCAQLGQELMVVVKELETGNQCMSTIFVEDKLKPELECTSDTLPCNVVIEDIDFESLIEEVDDNCDPDPTLWYSYVIQNLPCNPNGFTQQILVTWTATDNYGNSNTCQDVIFLKKPSLNSIVFPPNITVSCVNPNIDPSVTGEPMYNDLPINFACQISVWHSDVTIPMCNGSYKIKRTWTLMDWCTGYTRTGVQEIRIVDNTPPNITCPPNVTIGTGPGVCYAKYTLPTPIVSDNCADPAMIDIDITVSGMPGIFPPGQMLNLGLGTTLITMKATDPCGNTKICQYSVTVKDNTPPIISCPPNKTVSCTASTLPVNTGTATATDFCDATPTITYSDVTTASSDCGLGFKINRTWKAQDDSGNTACCVQMITLTDNVPPNITCPTNVTISCIASTLPVNTGSATATDMCDATPTITYSDVTTGGGCPQEYTIKRTWRATDDCQNSSTCIQTIIIDDNAPPDITCPANITIMCASGTLPVITGTATATDICDATPTISFTDVTISTGGPQQFILNRTWRATDDCANSSTCLQIITVRDETPPGITCPGNLTISCTANTLPPATGTASATDNCDATPTITFADVTVAGACPQERVITRTWRATDDCSNSSTCIQVIVVDDSAAPGITCPPNTTIQCTASTMPVNTGGSATATDNCDGAPFITFTDVTIGGACPQEKTINRTWKATDHCGNMNTCLQTIFIDDSVAPLITCPQNVTIDCTASTLPANTGSATATDNCDQSVTPTFADVTVAGGCPQEPTINRTWTATDDCGNASTCLQVIIVQDNQAPSITCPMNLTIDCSENPASLGEATATDNCDPTVTLTFSDASGGPGGGCLIGTTFRTWTATDDCGNSSTCLQVIVVTDGLPPAIECPPNITITCTQSTQPATTGTATATDGCDMSPTLTFSDVTVGGACPEEKTITRTWRATDDCGNSSTCNQIIVVEDNQAPIITCPPNININCNTSTAPATTGMATATDNCDPVVGISFSDVITGAGCPQESTITRTWSANDDCQNISTCVQIITIEDNSAPLVTCPANTTIDCAASSAPANTGGMATATDNCDATPTISFTDVTVGLCPLDHIIFRTWRATDDCGNSGTCVQTIVRDDTTPPVCVPQNITVTLNGNGMITIIAAQVDGGSTDNCSPVSLSVNPSMFNCDNIGANTVTLTVTDCSMNSSQCTATVTVNDGGGLQANCQDITITVDANGNAIAHAVDVNNGSGGGCNPGDLTFMLNDSTFDCSNIGITNIVILTVTDENGNTATCTAIVTVEDDTPPSITCPADVPVDCHTIGDPNNTGQWGNATGSDNCTFVITETHIINLNNCNVGTIIRTFTATDIGGNTATCIQVVTVTNPNPLDMGDIDWPDSPISVNICNSTDPEDLPPTQGFPIINPTALLCADVDVDFVDQVVMNVDNNPNTPCKVITRTWTITDACQQNGTFTFDQTINVQDMTPPNFTNINDMTKVANPVTCVAAFTLVANATDCAGVTITNNSPYSSNGNGANASGNYPIGVTTVLFTATDGCGNISTMDVVITVTDPNPAEFMCEKVVKFLEGEPEVAVNAAEFVIIIAGGCTDPDDYIISYSNTDPFDTVHIFTCADLGVTTFPLYFWNVTGTVLIDSCPFADLELCDPDDLCPPAGGTECSEGLIVLGEVKNETGLPVQDVEVTIPNSGMIPDMTNLKGRYTIGGLTASTGYEVMPIHDRDHKAGVSTLDLVMIQKHLLGRAKLDSPYKMIAADANHSGHITAVDLLEIRKLILGITTKFQNNTSWRFIDATYQFPDPFNPFDPGFPESIWLDSITQVSDTANFIGVKVGDVNGSFFTSKLHGSEIENRGSNSYYLSARLEDQRTEKPAHWEFHAMPGQGMVEGMQFSIQVGLLTDNQLREIKSEVLTSDQWYYNRVTNEIRVSWAPTSPVDLTGKVFLTVPVTTEMSDRVWFNEELVHAEAYAEFDGEIRAQRLEMEVATSGNEFNSSYQLFQNVPNPFQDGTVIRFAIPEKERVTLMIRDLLGRTILIRDIDADAGINELQVKNQELGAQGIYYYTLQTLHASLTRKMSYTSN